MSNKTPDSSSHPDQNQEAQKSQQTTQKSAIDPSKVVTPSEDLVYKGGYTVDPEEILANPAVAPEMLDDRRDNRPDLTRIPEDIQAEDIQTD